MLRKTARNAAAAVLLVVGVAGLFLPFLQGIAIILLAVVVADFAAKERLLARYRHTRLGRRLWDHHERRRRREANGNGGLAPESGRAPEPTGEAASEDR